MTKLYNGTIAGADVDTGRCFEVIDPATEEVIGEAPDCGLDELDRAVAAARTAFPAWAATPLPERQALVQAIGAILRENIDELSALLTAEHGKPLNDARGDVLGGAHWVSVYASMDIPTETTEDSEQRLVQVRRVPIGVVGALAPWNFPVTMAMMKVGPALVAGNTVVLKPSPFTPLTTLRIGELLRTVLPAGVLNIISGGDALGPLMTAHPGIDKITFTGSSATGRKVMASAAQSLKRVTLELGGNDAAIILPDVDVPSVAKQIFAAAFANSGQICIAAKRVYIHADVYDRFAAALTELANSAVVGNGTSLDTKFGPVQNREQFSRLVDLLADCREQGYQFLSGGEPIEGKGFFLPLTLVDNPPEDARIVQEEQFGPILPLLKFTEIDDVIVRANQSPYGLGATIWSGDSDRAIQIATRLETGNVWINQGQMIHAHSPFGGHKASGIGVESSLEGLLAYTNAQTVTLRKPRTI